MKKINPQIDISWKKLLMNEFEKEYFLNLKDFLLQEKSKYEIYPHSSKIFSAFNNCSFDKVKIVIIWQDPYHWVWQANWMCFSVNKWISLPPSLKNIFKEINNDLQVQMWDNGDLTNWAKQWVLLLNSILTVRKWQASSHKNKWWEKFIDEVINIISDKKNWIIFLLWGNFAQEKEKLIDKEKHYILKSAHPSPFSAHKWFFGNKHFSKANEILQKQWKEIINWKI